jgi:hypothetical protein
MLRNPYTDRHQKLFGGFSLRIGDVSPTGGMMGGEFLLVLLLHWNRAIHRLGQGIIRGTKLFFTTCEGEIWVRKTAKSLWKVSYIDHLQGKRVRAEVLCVPERLEVGLLSVSRKVLTGAQKAGIWTPDCAEMEQYLRDPEEYMRQVEAATADTLQNRGQFAEQSLSSVSILAQRSSQQHLESAVNPRFSQTMTPEPPIPPVISDPAERQRGVPPIFCPRCNAVLKPWGVQAQQSCSHCGFEVRLG